MKKSILLLSLTLGILCTMNAQITDIKFLIEYNDTTSHYDCKYVIAGGEATTFPHRIIFNSQYTIVVPAGTDLQIVEFHAPWEDNATYTGTIPCIWEYGPKELSPPAQPENDFHTIFPNISPPSAFNNLFAGDTITLFSLSADVDPCENAVRPFKNGIDPSSIDMPSGGDFSCGATIGSALQLYSSNLFTYYADNYISPSDSLSTCVDDCIILEPTIFCLGDSLKYVWSTGDTTETIEVCPTVPTDYFVLVNDNDGYLLDSIHVHVGIEPLIIKTANSTVCAGGSIILEGCPGFGTWTQSSSNGFGAVLDSISEGVTEVTFSSMTSGTFDIIFSIPGLSDTVQITVNPAPLVNIADAQICVNGSTIAAANIPGGTWISDNPSVASVIHNTGVITGHSSGSVTFVYYDPSGCYATTSALLVLPKPIVAVTGSDNICVGSTSFVTPTTGGTWQSSDDGVATVSNAGVVTGVGLGTTTLIFIETLTGCTSDGLVIEVSEMPESLFTGSDSICVNGTSSLSPSTGGTWQSSNPSVATIDNNGNITGVGEGTATFTFTSNFSSCSPITSETLWVFDEQITTTIFDTDLCIGETTQALPAVNGTWTSSDPSVATISAFSGLITGISEGTVTFTFTSAATTCSSDPTVQVTVNGVPEITQFGHDEICVGGSSQMLPSSGGTWTSSDPGIISIDNNGVFTANAAGGPVTFTWMDDLTTCPSLPSEPIFSSLVVSTELTGPNQICIGGTTTVEPSVGGTWSSSDPSIATVDNFGNITGLNYGVATFVFTSAGGLCQSDPSEPVQVNPGPTISIPSTSLCDEETMTLTSPVDGTWTSSNPLVAYVYPTTGIIYTQSPGTVTFTFTESSSGCSSTSEMVTIYEKPEIETNNPYALCTGLSTTLDPSVGGTWISSDPAIVTVNNLGQITTIGEGTAYLVFTDSNSGCESDSLELIVVESIATPIPNSNGPLCEGEDIQLTTDFLPGAYYEWTGPNGYSAFGQNKTISNATPADAGTYCLVITYGGCSSESGCIDIVINPSPATPTAYSNGPICEGEDLELTTDFVSNATYIWTGPGGYSSTDQNPVITQTSPSDNGAYCVQITVDGCESMEGCTDVEINNIPAQPSVNNNGPLCEGEDLELTTPDVVDAFYTWTGPNGFTSNLQNPTTSGVTPTESGTYCVIVNIDGCESESGCTYVEVKPTPATPIAGNNSPICEGQSINLTTGLVPGASYSWSGPNSFSSSNQNPVINSASTLDNGSYCVVVTVDGCDSEPSCTNVVIDCPCPITNNTISQPDPNEFCGEGEMITILGSDALPGDGTYSWEYSSNNGLFVAASGINDQRDYSTGVLGVGEHRFRRVFTVATSIDCEDISNEIIILVYESANAGFDQSLDCFVNSIAIMEASGSGIWSWGSTPGAAAIIIDISDPNTEIMGFQSPGEYYLIWTTDDGCTDELSIVVGDDCPCPITNNTITQPDPNEFCGESETLTILGSDALPTGGTYTWEYSSDNGVFVPANGINDQKDYTTNALGVGAHRFRRIYTIDNPIPCENISDIADIVVLSPPITPNATNNGPICETETIELSTDAVTDATYAWTGPGGFTSTDQNPTLLWTNPSNSGNYCVVVTVDGCESEAGCTNVIVKSKPSYPMISGNGPICEGDNLELTINYESGATYSWTGPDGFTSSEQELIIPNFTNPYEQSVYVVYCVVSTIDGCESNEECIDILIYSQPETPIASNNGPICEGENAELYANTIADAVYSWTGPNGFVSSEQNPVITNATTNESGSYCLLVYVDGCESEVICTDVIINPIDQASTIQVNSLICIGDNLELSTETLPNGLYEWTGPNGFQSFDQNPIIPTVSSDYSGIYTLHASNTLSQCPNLGVVIKEIEIINCFEPHSACDEIGADDIICDYNELDGVSGSLSNENTNGNQPSGFLCNSNDGVQNIAWIGFVALEGDYEIVINTTNCFLVNGDVGGVQIGVYSDCSFTNESEIFCENIYKSINETRIPSNTLTPGQTYFLYIDGFEGSLCDYSINIDGFYDNTYCTDYSKVTGVAYIDDNENGVYEVGETLLRNALISLSPGNLSVLTNDEGKYIINTPKGGATLTAKMNEGHWINDELTIEDLTIFETCVEGIDFGFVPNLFYQEANVSVANSITRCDWETKFYFTVENTGTIDLDAKFEFEFDDKASYFSTNLIGLQVNGNAASGDLGTMAPFEVRKFWITLKMPSGSTVLPVLEFKTTLRNSGGVQMDEYEQSEQLRCSYDPNDKREYPNRAGEDNLTLMDENLEYTIRFQNNGNDTAFQVKIVDPLDPNIDPSSIRVISSSHAVETCIENETLIFLFENINLVDSMTNYEGSQGYVSFRCNTKEDRLEYTIVHNTADIIFDTNVPIVTNTTINTLVSELCTFVTSEIDVEICEGENYHGFDETGTFTEVFPLEYGCDSTVVINLEVQGITYSSQNIEICEGEPFDLNGKEYILYESQVVRDSMVNDQGCISNVLIFNVEVNPVLKIAVDTVICDGYDYNGFTESGVYTIESFDEVTGCDIITTIDLEVLPMSDPSCIVGIDELEASDIKIYPIPARDVFFLEGDIDIDAVSIYTMNYQKVEELQFAIGAQKVQLSTDKLVQGLYIIAIESEGQIIYKKLIVE